MPHDPKAREKRAENLKRKAADRERVATCEGCRKPIYADQDYGRTVDDVYLHVACAADVTDPQP